MVLASTVAHGRIPECDSLQRAPVLMWTVAPESGKCDEQDDLQVTLMSHIRLRGGVQHVHANTPFSVPPQEKP